MKKIIQILFLSCLKATEMIEKKLHFKLSIKEKIQLKLHLMMCDACKKYEKQSILIEKGILKMHKNITTPINLEELKDRINKSLKDLNQNKN